MLLASLFLAALLQAAPPAPITIQYGTNVVTLNAEALATLPRQEVTAGDHGTPTTFEGVLLRRVLSLAKVPAGSTLRGDALKLIVHVEAADGYQAVFGKALYELFHLIEGLDGADDPPLGEQLATTPVEHELRPPALHQFPVVDPVEGPQQLHLYSGVGLEERQAQRASLLDYPVTEVPRHDTDNDKPDSEHRAY